MEDEMAQTKEQRKASYQKNKDKILAAVKKYRVENLDKVRESNRKYYKKNKQILAEKSKKFREANKDKLSAKSKEYREANKDDLRAKKKIYRENNKHVAKAWRDANAEKIKSYREVNKDIIKAKAKVYRELTKEKISKYSSEYRKNNRGARNALLVKYRAAKLQRTPTWVGLEELWLMQEVYDLAILRTKLHGFSWHVDHIIPLQGALVSGLHVPTNLQVIPWVDNIAKGNKYEVG